MHGSVPSKSYIIIPGSCSSSTQVGEPRGGQLAKGFFTRREARFARPLPDLPQGVKLIILNALRTAWASFQRNEPDLATDAEETTITFCLQEILNELRTHPETEADGFSASLFETVTREGAEVNFSGSSVQKQPDLVVRMRNLHPGVHDSLRWAAFIECKIVSRSRPVNLYCREGISRFVEGDYAWAMPSAMMVAYARDLESVEGSLTPYLAKYQDSADDPFATRNLPKQRSELSADESVVYASMHRRAWKHVNGALPGPVEILHLWLPVPASGA